MLTEAERNEIQDSSGAPGRLPRAHFATVERILADRQAEFDTEAAALGASWDREAEWRREAEAALATARREVEEMRGRLEAVDIASILGAHLPGDYTHLFHDDPGNVDPPVGCRCGWRRERGVSQHDHLAGALRAALANPSVAQGEGEVGRCDHPGIEHGQWSYVGICPACGVCKFIGHGPLCINCYATRAATPAPEADQ